MSKDNPEIGDVFEYKSDRNIKNHIAHIFEEGEAVVLFDNSSGNIQRTRIKIEDFKDFVYVGKAKGSVSDLFEVKE